LQEPLRLDGLDEAGPAAKVGEEHRDLASMTRENRLVARRDDRVCELRGQESLEPPEPFELLDVRLHPPLERPVQLLDRVVVALDPEQRTNSREQLVVVERFCDEVVRTGLDRLGL